MIHRVPRTAFPPILKIHFFKVFFLVNMLSGCCRVDTVQMNWGKICGEMDKTNVVALLGDPKEILLDDSRHRECWSYSPSGDVFFSDKKNLVVHHCVVVFVSNKVVDTYVTYTDPKGRRER